MRDAMGAPLMPTLEQVANVWLFVSLLLGVFAVLTLTWWTSEHLIDWCLARLNRRQARVIQFEQQRRVTLRRAMGGK